MNRPELGDGIYRLADVSRYTGIPLTTVRSWFKPRTDGLGRGPIFEADYSLVDGEFTVSFLNLIEAYVADFFRAQGVSPREIRRAHEVLQDQLASLHPFAHANLITDGRHIIQDMANRKRGPLVGVTSRQHWFPQWRSHLRGIEYGPSRRLATKWNIHKGVVIDPQINFGNPVVGGRAISTWIVSNQFRANQGDIDLVSKLYGIRKQDVLNAVSFEEGLGRSAA